METAKVDVRKLQMLNDRIAATIDALNQVRLSVHGLQHTSYPGVGVGQPFGGIGQYGQYGQYGQGIGMQQPWGVQGVPWQGTPWQQVGQFGTPFGQVPGSFGISHTSIDDPFQLQLPFTQQAQQWMPISQRIQADPYLAARLLQTFPFALSGMSPGIGV